MGFVATLLYFSSRDTVSDSLTPDVAAQSPDGAGVTLSTDQDLIDRVPVKTNVAPESGEPSIDTVAQDLLKANDPFYGLELPVGSYEPLVNSKTIGSAWFAATLKSDWMKWEATGVDMASGRLSLMTALQRSISVNLNQIGAYGHGAGSGRSTDSHGRPLRFVLNGYAYNFHDHEFPEYVELSEIVNHDSGGTLILDPLLVNDIRARVDEALASLSR